MSQNPLAANARTGIMLIQKRAKLKITSAQQPWTEKISFAFRTKISIFSGFKEQLALGRTCLITRELKICDGDVNEIVTSKYNFALS